jgi:hypothetical protein
VELAPALAPELLPGTLSLDAITVLDQRAEAHGALARRHELDRVSLHGHLVTALRAGALNGEATFSAMFEKSPGDQAGAQRTKRLAVAVADWCCSFGLRRLGRRAPAMWRLPAPLGRHRRAAVSAVGVR